MTNSVYPVFTALTCAAGDDTQPGVRSLASSLVINPGGGSIVSVAPTGLSLDEMHLYSRIVSIADSFDAMTTERVYQKAMDTYPSLQIMFSLKNAYDETALKAFVELMGPSGLANI